MRTITLEISKSTPPFDEREVLTMITENGPTHGYNIGQMRTAVSVLAKIKTSRTQAISLEDTEWQWLCDRLNNTVWTKASADALAMVDRILAAKSE